MTPRLCLATENEQVPFVFSTQCGCVICENNNNGSASYRATDGNVAAELDLGVWGSGTALATLSLSLYNLLREKNNHW